jgi:molecular chaperone HscB
MQYFDFYELPVSFLLDEGELKKRFLQKSRQYHPDFFTLETDEEQAKTLELSTLNNQAYRTLADFDLRMGYILDQKGLLAEEGKNEVPQDFLLDMMELNEALMELEFDFDPAVFENAQSQLAALEKSLLDEVMPVLNTFDNTDPNQGELKIVKDFFFKKRYLWRIQENLNRFAPASKEA